MPQAPCSIALLAPHLQRYLSMTLSLFQSYMLLPHVGQSNSLFKSPHSCKNLTPFSWSENEPKEQCGRKTISPHCTMPEGSLGDERQVLHFVLVSLDHSWERLRHVIVLKVQPQFRKKCITQKNKTTDFNLPQLDFGKQKHWYNFTGTRRWKTKPQILDFNLSPSSVCCMLSKPQILFYLYVSVQLNSWTRTIYRTDHIV